MAMARYEAEKFNGRNDFGLWRIKMKALLTHQGLAEALEPVQVNQELTERQRENRRKAHSAIKLNLDDKVLREVAREESAASMWKKLEELYMTKSLANRLYLKQRLYSFKFLDDRSLGEQLDQFNKLIDDLENVDAKMDEEDKAIALLNALPKSFEHLKDAMLYGREKAITLIEVQVALKTKDMQKVVTVTDGAGEILNIKKFKGKGFQAKGKFNKSQSLKPKDKYERRETRTCHYCQKPGHLKKNCYSWKRKQTEESQGQGTSNAVQENKEMKVLNVMDINVGEKWIIDSGCSFHICSHKEWFEEIQPAQGSVILGNDQTCKVHGIGKIRLRLDNGALRMLTEVRLIPDIKRNLISLGVLQSKGCEYRSQDQNLEIYRDSQVLMTAKRRNGLYYLDADAVIGQTCVAQRMEAQVWHRRLGHIGIKGLKMLDKEGLIHCSDIDAIGTCEECIMGKGKKLPFPKGKHISKAPLDYAHSDLWGPTHPKTLGGGRYFMTIIDDFSRKLWVYVLKEKSDAFRSFKEWCILMERQKGITLKCLRTNCWKN